VLFKYIAFIAKLSQVCPHFFIYILKILVNIGINLNFNKRSNKQIELKKEM